MKSNLHARNLQHLRLSLSWDPDLGQDGQDQCWDTLVNWCEKHGAYLGGTPSRAFILIRSAGSHLQRNLHKRLSNWSSLGDFVMTPVTIPERHTAQKNMSARYQKSAIVPDDGAAMLEALAHYQQHLLEQMQWIIDLLPLVQYLHPSVKDRSPSVRADKAS